MVELALSFLLLEDDKEVGLRVLKELVRLRAGVLSPSLFQLEGFRFPRERSPGLFEKVSRAFFFGGSSCFLSSKRDFEKNKSSELEEDVKSSMELRS